MNQLHVATRYEALPLRGRSQLGSCCVTGHGALEHVQHFVFAGVLVQRGPGAHGASVPSNTASSPAVSPESALTPSVAPGHDGRPRRTSPGASRYGPARRLVSVWVASISRLPYGR